MIKILLLLFIPLIAIQCENLIKLTEFRKAVTDNVYPSPSEEQYDTINRLAHSAGGITTKPELAMFLAQVLWESAGLQAKKEIACQSSRCPNHYRTGKEKPDKYYYGRGYIQLTWLYNYEACSKALYNDTRLVENPNLVSDTEEAAWGCAFWYWKAHCHNAPGVSDGHFGATTMAINGALECKGPYKQKAFKRFTIYVKVLEAFDLKNYTALQDGCYPLTGSDAPNFKLCKSIGTFGGMIGMDAWCNDNCNVGDASNCPTDKCQCS